jgi:hypothetical protein
MSRLPFIALGSVMITYGLASAPFGCGTDEVEIGNSGGADDAATGGASSSSSSSGSTSSSSGSGSSSSGSSGGEDDAGDDADVADAAADADPDAGDAGNAVDGSSPGAVGCYGDQCTLAAGQYCCARGDGGGDCQTQNNQCGFGSSRLRCDEPADCNAGQRCCLSFGGGGGGGGGSGSACTNNACGFGQLELCQTNTDCTNDGGGCKVVTCQDGRTFRACNTNGFCL